jgi:hypothetical protein
MAWTTPKTWAVNDVLSASDLNTYVRDNERALSQLSSYTPTWTAATTNPAIGNGVLEGRYILVDDWCWVQVMLAAGSTTTYGSGTYGLSLPVAATALSGGTEQNLLVTFNDLGLARYMGVAYIFTGATSFGVNSPTTWNGGTQRTWNQTDPFTFGNGDTMVASGIYRVV